MDALAAYDSSDEELSPRFDLQAIVQVPLAPQMYYVNTNVPDFNSNNNLTMYNGGNQSAHPAAIPLNTNLKIADMHLLSHDGGINTARTGIRASLNSVAIDDYTFNEQFRVGQSLTRRAQMNIPASSGAGENQKLTSKSKRKWEETLAIDDDHSGPWAEVTNRSLAQQKQEQDLAEIQGRKAAADAKKKGTKADIEAAAKEEEERTAKKAEKVHAGPESEPSIKNSDTTHHLPPPISGKSDAQIMHASSTFHGESEVDYQGRSWTVPPAGLRPGESEDIQRYIPKKCIKKFSGHTKGVQAIQFLPDTGHLLLSAGMEGKCKIWDIYGDRSVRRTYHGHSEAVRAVSFSNTGVQFLSAGYDRVTRLWDTETGQAIGTFCNNKMGYECKFYPIDNHLFLVPCSDHNIYQWDTRTGHVVQEYTHHLGAVNTVTFFDEGRKFFSTSDDKKILSWEFDMNVPIRIIAEQDMFSIPAVTMHPNLQYWAGQSMNNTIVIYSCIGEKVRLIKNKVFKGHNNAGYACQIGFSADGQYVTSGDGFGNLHVWDWKTTKAYRKFQAHDNGPCMGNVWHPRHASWMATCGWDGLIKLWE